MKLPTLTCLISSVTLISVIAATPDEGATPKTKPNILFIAIDDLRPELGCYGNTHIKSPHIYKGKNHMGYTMRTDRYRLVQ